ncbi:MAG TPA: DNA-formamidopyrimidine glycosylase family protein [Methanomassiliicoccales archaeon]|nr:DNA-formamidopyrimidine glycosylase family protein [Methanomassiliicoccales archaeon]
MPELPEVEMARKLVNGSMLHLRVLATEVLDPGMLQEVAPEAVVRVLQDKEVVGTARHGKNLFICFRDGALHIHLGMSGSISYEDDADRHSPHERLRLVMDRGVMILDDPRRFGRIGWVPSVGHLVSNKGLGPDALSVSDEEFVSRLVGRKSSIKPTLLDQSVVAGVGNLYADETLFQERLHSATRTDSLSTREKAALGMRIREVLETSISVRTDFSLLPDGYLLRDRRERAPCPRCEAELEVIRIGGRTTVFCPACQSLRAEP